MPYQLTFALYLIVTTAQSLLSRTYSSKTTLNPLISGIPTNALIALPMAIAYALATDAFMAPSLKFILIALVEAAIGTTYGFVAIYAQKHSDASTFATMIKLHAVIVVIVSALLLGESLSFMQAIGGSVIMLSGLLLAKGGSTHGLRYNLLAVPLLAAIVLLSRIMVIEANVGMYLVTATTLGLIIKLSLKGKEVRVHLPELKKEFKIKAVLSLTAFLQALLFNLSADMSGNVSLISSLASLKVITVMVASYIFLGEHSNLHRKALAAGLSVLGLLLM